MSNSRYLSLTLKPTLNIEETQARETTKLFTKIWKGMADALAEANRVFVIGYSFPSTDHHFRTFIHWVNHRRHEEYADVYCCVRADSQEGSVFDLDKNTLFETAARFFPVVRFHRRDQGFEAFVEYGSSRS